MLAALSLQITVYQLGWAVLASVAGFMVLEWLWFRLRYDWHKIPGPPIYPLVGDVLSLRQFSGEDMRIHEYIYHWWKKLGQPKIMRRQNGPMRQLLVCDPALAQQFVTGHRGLTKSTVPGLDKIFGPDGAKNIVLRDRPDEKWKAVRRQVAQAFSTENMRKTFPAIRETAEKLVRELKKVPTGETLEITHYLTYMAFEIISAWGMGMKTDAIQTRSNPFYDAQADCQDQILQDLLNPVRVLVKKFLPFTKLAKISRFAFKRMYVSIDYLYDQMDMDTPPADDDLSIAAALKRARTADPNHRLTEAELKSEAAIIFLGGTDTTAISISLALCAIATHPNVQSNLASELREAGLVGNSARDLEFKDLNSLQYLNAVIKETLRLLPATPLGSPRLLQEDTTICGYRIPKGTVVSGETFVLNRHRECYENEDEFDPDRWVGNELPMQQHDTVTKVRNIWTFSNGPRNCVGQRLAIVEMQITLALLLGKFSVELGDQMGGWEGAIAKKYDKLVTSMKGGVKVQLFPRD